MSFPITFMRSFSPLNKIKKQLSTIVTLTGDLRNECDILHPEFVVDTTLDLSQCNYLQVPLYNRYYFIEEITILKGSLYRVSAHVDVLESYRDKILANTCVILRQENEFNLLMNDGVFKCQQNPRIYQRDFPVGFTDPSYVLIVAGS